MQNILLKENKSILYLNSLFQLMKPRVMSLVIFTCIVGMLIAPSQISFLSASISILAVAIGAGAAGTLNMWYEADLDALMKRTCLRPIPTGKITKNQALVFGLLTSFLSIVVLYIFSNLLSAIILATTILFYVVYLYYVAKKKNCTEYSDWKGSWCFSSNYWMDNSNRKH